MITKEEFEKAVEVCTNTDETCEHCPLSKKFFFMRRISYPLHKRKRACTVCQQHKLGGIKRVQ